MPSLLENLRIQTRRLKKQTVAYQQAQAGKAEVTRQRPRQLEQWARRYLLSYFTHPLSRMHRWLTERLDEATVKRGLRLALKSPRGSAKSTWVTLFHVLREACEGRERYIWIISDTAEQARDLLDAIKSELEENELLAQDYPEATGEGPVWQRGKIKLRNGVVIEALGTGNRIRGKRNRAQRPTLIILDDPENDEQVVSPVQRQKTWEWFNRAVLNAGTAETNVIALGTALHRECLVMRLDRTPGWTAKTFTALEYPTAMHVWREWEDILTDLENEDREQEAKAFYERRRPEMDAGAVLLWPEREPLYELMRHRLQIGPPAFESEKRNNPVNPEACEFPESYFDYPGFWWDKLPEGIPLLRVMALDPSKGKDAKRGDYSAIIYAACDQKTGRAYIDADLKRRTVEQIAADSVEGVKLFRPEGFGCEINQFQELLAKDILREAKRQHIHVPAHGIDNRLNKEVRIRRVGAYLSQRRLVFKRKSAGVGLLLQQLRDFPIGDHDDGPDALEMVLRLAGWIAQGRSGEGITRLTA